MVLPLCAIHMAAGRAASSVRSLGGSTWPRDVVQQAPKINLVRAWQNGVVGSTPAMQHGGPLVEEEAPAILPWVPPVSRVLERRKRRAGADVVTAPVERGPADGVAENSVGTRDSHRLAHGIEVLLPDGA